MRRVAGLHEYRHDLHLSGEVHFELLLVDVVRILPC